LSVVKAGSREWVGLGVLSLACVLYAMDLTVLHLAVPQISADLHPTSSQLLWIMDIYGFFVAGSLITMGNLGDRIGRRKLLLIGAITFAITSALAAFSTTAEMLIISRALLGVSGATLAPSTLSLIRNMFHDDKQRSVAIGVWVSSFSAGAAIGPLVGGVLLEYFWWGSVFLLAIPIMIALLILGPILLPEFKDKTARRLDPISAALSLGAILSIIYGIKQIAQDGLGFEPVIFVVLGLAIGAAFLFRQKRIVDPLVDLALFKVRAFSGSLVTFLLGVFVAFGVFVFISQYLQLVVGLSPLEAGLWMLPWALAFVAGSTITPRLAHRVKPGYIIAVGLMIAGVGIGLLFEIDANTSFWWILVSLVISSLGLAPVFTLAMDLVVGSAPPARAGAASAISETTAELGGALGIAVMGSIGTALYRKELAELIPDGIPQEARLVALDTLGGAVQVSKSLPSDIGNALLGAAHQSFLHGLYLSMIVGVALTMGAAVLVLVMLKGVKISQNH
jgi:DHA2 family multidrug resistance protein-like MFS transporter